jgi:predicted ATP-dependent endonuclease of OLD family
LKIAALQISNIWSFKYHENIEDAPKISFDENLNILIGQNGAGKSTVLEIINFIFRRVLFAPYIRYDDLFNRRQSLPAGDKKSTIRKLDNWQNYKTFRLEPNYDYESNSQQIRITVRIDEVDRSNIEHLRLNREKLSLIVTDYSSFQFLADGEFKDVYEIDITLNKNQDLYSVTTINDPGFIYLTEYSLYKEAIRIHNEINPSDLIQVLAESFSLVSSYRNYSTYSPTVSLSGTSSSTQQIQAFRSSEYSKSMNATESSEPTVFNLVRLQMAEPIIELISGDKTEDECVRLANQLPFVHSINEKLKIVKLRVEIKLTDKRNWEFAFSFIDTKRGRPVTDISALSAGQKAIVHLVFEAYGRGELLGGLVIIDEPEIHLHLQFQNEYLRVIEKLTQEQFCQYVLVTHSEALVNSGTISSVIRLSLDNDGYTKVTQPSIAASQKWLVKILDNRRSTHAFFGSKVLLVEGETDRYFYRALLGEIESRLKCGLSQEITVLNVEGKRFDLWRTFFDSFGLKTYVAGDLDCAWKYYDARSHPKLNTPELVQNFLDTHPDVMERIDADFEAGFFILKAGVLEDYLGIRKDLGLVIDFCENRIGAFIDDTSDSKVRTIREILSQITDIDESNF